MNVYNIRMSGKKTAANHVSGKIRLHALIDPVILSIFSLILFLGGGTPYSHPDFLLGRVINMLSQKGNPGFFNYPALVLYFHGAVYSFVIRFMGPEKFMNWRMQTLLGINRGPGAWMPGHLVTAAFALAGVLAVWFVVKRMTKSRTWAFIAGAALAVSPLWAVNAHFLTVDIPLGALVIIALATCVIYSRPSGATSTRGLVIMGIAAGLCAGAKYNGAIVLFAIELSLLRGPWRKGSLLFKTLAIPALCALAAFCLTNPFIFTHWPDFIRDFTYELHHAGSMGHNGYETGCGLWYGLSVSLKYGMGTLGLAAGLAGLAILAADRKAPSAARIALPAFAVLHMILIGSSKLAFQRYMIPMLPVLAAGLTWGAYRAAGFFTKHNRKTGIALAILLAAGMFIPNLAVIIRHNTLLKTEDTRMSLMKILYNAHLTGPSRTVFAGDYTWRQVQASGMPVKRFTRDPGTDLSAAGPDIWFFDSFSHDRFVYGRREPSMVRRYHGYDHLYMVIISCLDVPKNNVPYSPKSLYSPWPPDLFSRRTQGPYIEILLRSSEDAAKIRRACKSLSIPFTGGRADRSWYLEHLSTSSATHRNISG